MKSGYSLREQRGWYVYDWANSVFYTSVVTVFLGPYLTSLAKDAATDGHVHPMGIPIAAQSFWPYLVSLSVLLQVLVLPLVGAVADYGHRKKEMLGVLAFIGAGATAAMYWLTGDRYLYGGLLFLTANVAFGAAMVIYNSFLSEVAPPEDRDAVSSNGWGLGYLGGGLALALHLVLFAKAESWGLTQGDAVRIALGTSGVWWAVFTLVPMVTLRNRIPSKTVPDGSNMVIAGVKQLAHTLMNVRRYPQTLLFLVAYLIYNDAIQTVIAMAAQFGAEELKLSMSVLTSAILLTQFVAFGGALLFDRIARRTGNRNAVLLALVVWSGVLIYVYFVPARVADFYVAAGLIGLVMGGSQALSRSIYSFMIPKGQEAEYFSVYEISDKGTSWLGPLFFGLALQWTGSFRVAIVSLIVFFLAGIALLSRVNVRQAAIEAGNEPPPLG